MSTLVIEGAHVATVDPARAEYAGGHVVVTDNVITAVGPGRAPDDMVTGESVRRVDASGCLITPGFVNTHHHLYQWITRGLAVDDTLFGWLTTLYPCGAGSTRSSCTPRRPALWRGWPAPDAPRRPTTTTSSRATAATCWRLRCRRRGASACGFIPTRGSMDLGQSSGGLPPDNVVEDVDDILAATESAIDTFHDPSFGSMLRIGVAPCSPFSVTADLLKQSADLARRAGVRMHTHLCETVDEEEFCQEHLRPVAGRVRGGARLARSGRLARTRRAPVGRGDRTARRDRHVRRALPDVERAARCGHLPQPGPARRRRRGRARAWTAPRRTRRAPCSRRSGTRCCSRGPAAVRARSRCGTRSRWRPWAAPACSVGRPRSVRSRRASSPTSPCGGWTRCRTSTSPIRSPRWCWGRRRRWSCCWSNGRAGRRAGPA